MNIFKIAKSYVFSKNKTKLTRIHSYIATIGIIIGVTALIVVSSAMNGFSEYMYNQLNINWDITMPLKQSSSQEEEDFLTSELNQKEGVEEVKVMNYIDDIYINGYSSRLIIVEDEDAKRLELKNNRVYLTKSLESYVPDIDYILIDIYNNKELTDDGFPIDQAIMPFEMKENIDLSSKFKDIFMTRETLESYFFVDLSPVMHSMVKVKIDNFFNTKSFESYQSNPIVEEVTGWHDSRKSLYQTLQLEQTVIKIVLFFIILVSCFNIVSTLTLIITEKKQDIFVLKTIGYSDFSVLFMFLFTGAWIGFLGLLLGTFFGILITINLTEILYFIETILGLKFIPDGVTMFPYKLDYKEIVNINMLTSVFIFTSCFLPSMNTLSINPAEGLKDE